MAHLKNTEAANLRGFRRRLVRVVFTDPNATDSDDDDGAVTIPRMKRHVTELDIRLDLPAPPRRTRRSGRAQVKRRDLQGEQRKFRGVRLRPWGRFAAEIRDPVRPRKRLWLGTFGTAEEAAWVYDAAAIRLYGAGAVTNFPVPGGSKDPPFPSPTSALRCGEAEDEGFRPELMGWELYAPRRGRRWWEEEEFGDLDTDDLELTFSR